jgi:transposase
MATRQDPWNWWRGDPMAQNFRPCDRNQQMLLSPNMRDWLPRDHFVHFVVGLVESFEFTDFVKEYRADGRGGAAFHPRMMATLLFYAYCDGERSSRQIEERCQTDMVYRYITGNNAIDHVTICRFRDRFEDQIAALFVPVLAVCLKAGLGNLSLAAIDGTKLRCPASLRANRTLGRIEKEIVDLTTEIEVEVARIVGEKAAAPISPTTRCQACHKTLLARPAPCPTSMVYRSPCTARQPG